MGVNELIEQLQDLVEHSSMFPWPGRRAVSYDEFFRLTEELKRQVPAELTQAAAIMEKRDALLADASRQAREITDQANQQALSALEGAKARAEQLLSREEITKEAHRRAQEIIAQAEAEGEELRRNADAYAAALLDRLATFVSRMQQSIDQGRRSLAQVQPAGQPPEAVDDR